MKNDTEFPKTLMDAIKYFADADKAINFMASIRWPDGKCKCPVCKAEETTFLSTRRIWKCRKCAKQFSVKVGTIFEDSALGFDKWLPAFWMIVNAKNGISSCELARALGVTQKTAWFMLHRIRLAIQNGSMEKMDGEVEADETYIGGLAKNMHKGKRKVKGTGATGKTTVLGIMQRGGKVHAQAAFDFKANTLISNIENKVVKGTMVYTDEHVGYSGLAKAGSGHRRVMHSMKEYVQGKVHTNCLENFWSLLKRTIRGTYVSVEPFHLFRYLDEQSFRYNERENTDSGRFLRGIVGVIGKRLEYSKLIGAISMGALPAV